MQALTPQETTDRLPFHRLIAALQAMFTQGCHVPLRHTHAVGTPDSGQGTVLLMPAWQDGGYLGVKTVSIYPNNRDQGLPGLHSVYVLFDAKTGVPLALLDGDVITSRRTAAASALAASYLSRPDAHRLLVVGAGRVASLLSQAYRAVRPIDQVQVWDIDAALATRLVERLQADGLRASLATDLEAATASADIISCATLSTEPLVRGAWLRPGTHLDLIGGFTPTMRESDDACLVRSTVFVDTDEAAMKAGDLLSPMGSGVFHQDAIAADLAALCRGQHQGRSREDEITLFKSVGTALEDLAAAALAYAPARDGSHGRAPRVNAA
ncbi:MAG: hypothetical protein RI884_2982 [Pseudomonadota bacterium]